MFPRLDYLEWIQGRPEVALYDLASSELRGDRDYEPALVPPPLADLDDPPVGASVELQLAQEYGVDPEQVLVTHGATTANLLAAAATVRLERAGESSGDGERKPTRVLVEKPGYEPLVESPRGVGTKVDRFLRTDEYRLDPGRVDAAMTPRTRLVSITNRHNPSGRLTERDTIREIASVARENDARLLVDEVYAPYVSDSETVESGSVGGGGAFGGITAAGLKGTVVTGSLTKFHGLGDVKLGWLIGDRSLVEAARTIEHHFSSVAGPSRVLARRALHNADHLGAKARAMLAENAELLTEFVAGRDDIHGTVEPGSSFAFLNPEGVDGDELSEAAWEEGLLVVPGRFFDSPEWIRVSLGRNPETAAAGLEALGEVLDALGEGDARQTKA